MKSPHPLASTVFTQRCLEASSIDFLYSLPEIFIHMNGSLPYTSFCTLLILIIYLGEYSVLVQKAPFILQVQQSMMGGYHNLCNQLPTTVGHLGCFQSFVITNSVPVNNLAWINLLNSLKLNSQIKGPMDLPNWSFLLSSNIINNYTKYKMV